MIDQVYGRELPPMHEWTRALLDEAIRAKVEFGVLVPGQGMVTGRMVQAIPRARLAIMRVTEDPRDRLIGVDFPAEMRFVGEIRKAAPSFSLMREAANTLRATARQQAARRLIAKARVADAQSKAQSQTLSRTQQAAQPAARAKTAPPPRFVRVSPPTGRRA